MSAAALRVEAAAKDELAGRIEAEARRLPDVLAPIFGRFGPDVWRGPAADEFAMAARRWRASLDAEADVLTLVARRLRQHAAELREQARHFELAEAAEAARIAAMTPQQRTADARIQ